MAKWLAKGHTVRRDLTPRSEIPGYSRPLLALQETNIRFLAPRLSPLPPQGSSSSLQALHRTEAPGTRIHFSKPISPPAR